MEIEAGVSIVPGDRLRRAKTLALAQLAERKLPVPPTVMGGAGADIYDMLKVAQQWMVPYYYVRACISDIVYPHYDYRVSTQEQLESEARNLELSVRKGGAKEFDIMIQPLLTLQESGTLLIGCGRVIVEQLTGAPFVLLREGYYQRRSILTESGETLGTQRGVQPFSAHFDRGTWRRQSPRPVMSSIDTLVPFFQDVAHDHNPVVLEVGWVGGTPLFLDMKVLPYGSFPLLQANYNDAWLVVTPAKEGGWADSLQLLRPAYGEIERAKQAPSVEVLTGAITSHLCVHLAEKGVPCRIRPT
jgi:hypothetical protein